MKFTGKLENSHEVGSSYFHILELFPFFEILKYLIIRIISFVGHLFSETFNKK